MEHGARKFRRATRFNAPRDNPTLMGAETPSEDGRLNDPLKDRVVEVIGHKYQIEGEIGRGGMSVVYRALDQRLNRRVAIKVLPPELAYDPAIRTRFTREAQTSAQLAHPHIVPIYDVGEGEAIAYFVMTMVTGGNLAALLAREPQQPVDEVRRVLREIADALAYAHLRGVIHRDIKPDNILLDEHSGRAMVTDFGIARAMEGGTRLTVTGIAVGTPTYMSPEQAQGDRDVDGRSDLYSLGVIGYQMLTGRVPFTGGNTMALLLKHVSERPRPIAELRPDAPRALREVIERAMTKEPQDRWPNAEAMRDALVSGETAAAWRSERREPVRYSSPVPADARRGADRSREPRAGGGGAVARKTTPSGKQPPELVMEQPHLVPLTPEQRDDLRLWHGRVNLYDRIKAARGYFWLTFVLWVGGLTALAGVPDVPPLLLAPAIPIWMSRKMWRRTKSLRSSGLKARRVYLMPRAKWVLPAPAPTMTDAQLEKVASREILDGPHGSAIKRAAADRAAILEIAKRLSKEEKGYLPDLVPTVNGLVERVSQLAQLLHRLEESYDPRLVSELDGRIAEVESDSDAPEGERRLGLLRRQRETVVELGRRRDLLARQLDNAGLALGNLRLDLVKFRASGLQSAFGDVSNATQEARALSREIGAVLDAAAEVKAL